MSLADETFGERLRRLRCEKGWSLDRLGRETEISRCHLWKLEKGHPNPGLALIRTLARALDCSPGHLADSKP